MEADRGDVWLDGTVPQYHLIRQAVVAAREVPGVRSVRSDLEIDRAYAYPPGRFFGYAHDAYPYGAFTYPYPPPD